MTGAAGNGTALWYLTRGSGAIALLLLTATVVLGVAGVLRVHSQRWPRFAVAALHRDLTLIAIAFVAAHVVTTVADAFAPIGLLDAVVPFRSPYRPLWLGLGAVAFDLLLALTATSLLRARLGLRAWRALHWLAYASWPFALVHALGTGSDARTGWLVALSLGSGAAVAAAILLRLARARARARFRAAAAGAALAAALTIALWYRGGPARPGWAARAGTPASLLPAASGSSPRPVRRLAWVPPSLPPSFSGRLSGRIAQSGNEQGNVGVAIGANLEGSVRGILRLTLWGSPVDGGGVAMTSSRVSFAPLAAGGRFDGRVVALDGQRLVAAVVDGRGTRLRLSLRFRIDRRDGSVGGTLHASRAAGSEDGDAG
jgi:hypothetical protein